MYTYACVRTYPSYIPLLTYCAYVRVLIIAFDGIRKLLPAEWMPLVCKVGTAHAGYGKMRLTSKSDWEDLKSVLSMKKEYYTTEPFIPNIESEYRIQKIGTHY